MKKHGPYLFALFGNPVTHSLSPLMHNAAYKHMDIDAIYKAVLVEDLEEAMASIKEIPLRGVSVTIPFKEKVIPYLDEIDEAARRIGAVNTILNNDNGRLIGYNTDWLGLVRSLQSRVGVKGKRFVIIGAGGVARGAVFGILNGGGDPIVINRTKQRGEKLAKDFGIPFVPLEQIAQVEADCLINATSVGLAPERDRTPVPKEILPRFSWVMDCIYNPLQTRLLREAREAGCRTISGLEMFVLQGAEQIKIWTGEEPPVAMMRELVRRYLGGGDGD